MCIKPFPHIDWQSRGSRGCNLPKGKRDYNTDCISCIFDIRHAKSACKSRSSDCVVQISSKIPYRRFLLIISISITSTIVCVWILNIPFLSNVLEIR